MSERITDPHDSLRLNVARGQIKAYEQLLAEYLDRLSQIAAERDEAREAARYLFGRVAGHHVFGLGVGGTDWVRWAAARPWLEQEPDE